MSCLSEYFKLYLKNIMLGSKRQATSLHGSSSLLKPDEVYNKSRIKGISRLVYVTVVVIHICLLLYWSNTVTSRVIEHQLRYKQFRNTTDVAVKVMQAPTVCENRTILPVGSLPVTALASLPGSGNTWLRYLIESVTGIYTGSIYNDKTLSKGGFLGEELPPFEGRTIAVKMHKMKKRRRVDKTIFLVRDLYDAIKADFNRIKGTGEGTKHTKVADAAAFKTDDWPRWINKRVKNWRELTNDVTSKFAENGKLLVVHYENLKSNLRPELERIVKFLQLPLDEERLICTLEHGNGKFHRPAHALSFNPFNETLTRLVEDAKNEGLALITKFEH